MGLEWCYLIQLRNDLYPSLVQQTWLNIYTLFCSLNWQEAFVHNSSLRIPSHFHNNTEKNQTVHFQGIMALLR